MGLRAEVWISTHLRNVCRFLSKSADVRSGLGLETGRLCCTAELFLIRRLPVNCTPVKIHPYTRDVYVCLWFIVNVVFHCSHFLFHPKKIFFSCFWSSSLFHGSLGPWRPPGRANTNNDDLSVLQQLAQYIDD